VRRAPATLASRAERAVSGAPANARFRDIARERVATPRNADDPVARTPPHPAIAARRRPPHVPRQGRRRPRPRPVRASPDRILARSRRRARASGNAVPPRRDDATTREKNTTIPSDPPVRPPSFPSPRRRPPYSAL
jgi:hypothetical protein